MPEEEKNMSDIAIERPEAHPGVLVIRMNRPDKKNAITRAMYVQMTEALVAANADDSVKAAVFFGVPGSFSAGNDLADFMEIARDVSLTRDVHAFIHQLPMFEKPLLSGVDGLAIGIGTTLNLHCDLTFATPRAFFRTPFTDLALVPEAASSLLGPRLMGAQRAFAMFAAGIGFSAEEAREAGLVWKIVGEDVLEATVLAAASALAEKPRQALAITRKLLKGSVGEIHARMEDEALYFNAQLQSREANEAFSAFINKKK
jgi:enoyl-CoA hydratase/carnithine racemase